MTKVELKTFLGEIGISQAEFARLIGVTPRAVTLWMSDERSIPGPAEAYVRLFRLLPQSLRQIELAQLKDRGTDMRDGMFGISFQGEHGAGMGMLVFDTGKVYGTDTEGARYDGSYIYHEDTGKADVLLKVSFPAGVTTVLGISNPYEWSIDVSANIDPKKNAGNIPVKTSLGKMLNAQFKYLRPLPNAE